MSFVGLTRQSLLLQAALLASLDTVPVFCRHKGSPALKKDDGKSRKTATTRTHDHQQNGKGSIGRLGSSLTSSNVFLPLFRLAVGGLLVLLFSMRENDNHPSRSLVVLPMILRRLVTPFVTHAWPRIVANFGQTESQQDDGTRPIRTGSSTSSSSSSWIQILVDGGPLGPGSGKLVQSIVGVLVAWVSEWISQGRHQVAPSPLPSLLSFCRLGSPWAESTSSWWWLPALVLVLSAAVNGVLWAWSYWQKSRGSHDGVDRLVRTTMGRSLTPREHLGLLLWALVNATCEEITARGLQRGEFRVIFASVSSSSSTSSSGHEQVTTNSLYDGNLHGRMNHPYNQTHFSNLGQALVFGVAHYYGIPSGWTGVGLTFIYGLLMGFLADAGHGLLYPILAHTVADYFIFATIARRKVD